MTSRWPYRIAVTCAAAAGGLGALVAPVAMAERATSPAAGGNGVRHFYAFDGYADSNEGCDDFGENPNVKPGRGHTSTILGYLWLDERGRLRADGEATGELQRDGSFHLDFPQVGPAALRRIEGRIGPPNPDGLDAPVTGGWTVPYPNGTSQCLVHFVITDGHVNLERGFGIPLTEKPANDSGTPMVPIGVGLVALAGLGGLLAWKKPWKPRCGCTCTAKIVGDHELFTGDTATTWTLEPSAGGRDALDTWLVGTVPDAPLPDGKPRPPKKLRRRYAVEPSEKCTGGGRVSTWGARWALGETAADHVVLDVVVTAGTQCADGTTATITCKHTLTIALHPHCGPDITDQYIAALNRVIDRVRARNQRLKALGIDMDDFDIGTAIGAGFSAIGSKIGVVDWDEAEFGPLHIGEFLVANGPWINFRPYSQAYKRKGGGDPPYWEPGDCPSCLQCGATITFLGTCLDNYVTDAMMYGVACGLLGVNRQSMVTGGLFAKWAGDHHLVQETHTGAIPAWVVGFRMGEHARANPSYVVGAVHPYLIMLLKGAPRRFECRTCSKRVAINGIDWASLDWSTGNLLGGHAEKTKYPSPPPSTTTPFPTKKKLIKLPTKKKP